MSILAGALLAISCVSAFAQSSTTAPQQTTATYEDWVVRCETREGKPGTQPEKACEMVQFTQLKGRTGVLTQIAIGRPAKGQPVRIVIQVPIAVWLPTGVKLISGGKDDGLSAWFKRCLPTACFADVEVKDDVIKKFRAATEPGKLRFKDVNQKDVTLPVSFKGFSAAYDALLKS